MRTGGEYHSIRWGEAQSHPVPPLPPVGLFAGAYFVRFVAFLPSYGKTREGMDKSPFHPKTRLHFFRMYSRLRSCPAMSLSGAGMLMIIPSRTATVGPWCHSWSYDCLNDARNYRGNCRKLTPSGREKGVRYWSLGPVSRNARKLFEPGELVYVCRDCIEVSIICKWYNKAIS